jgi:hypothetical protein
MTASSSGRKSPKPERRTRSGAAAPAGAENASDTWLDERLRALFQNDLNDPLPEDMINLVRGSGKRRGSG